MTRQYRVSFVPPKTLQERFERELARPWEPDKVKAKDSGQAAVLSALERHADALLAQDPWIPVPQTSCTFTFGSKSRPLPICALLHLWKTWPSLQGDCPKCAAKAAIRGYSFGGLLTIGGITGACLQCGNQFVRWIGGLASSQATVQPLLKDTPFYLNQIVYGRAVTGQRRLLYEALQQIADPETLPSPEWVSARVPASVSLRGAPPVICQVPKAAG
jgi:hypothetical protein